MTPESRGRRVWLSVRRKLKAGGRILARGAITGAGTYAGLRLLSPVFRGASRVKFFRRVAPSFAASTRRLGRHGSALEWGLATGALGSGSQLWSEVKKSGSKRYARWMKG